MEATIICFYMNTTWNELIITDFLLSRDKEETLTLTSAHMSVSVSALPLTMSVSVSALPLTVSVSENRSLTLI